MVTDRHTHSLTEMQHNDPAQYTVLGWVKKYPITNITKELQAIAQQSKAH